MRRTLIRLAVVLAGLVVAGSVAGGTAYADEVDPQLPWHPFELDPPMPDPDATYYIVCPPLCGPIEEDDGELEPADEPAEDPDQGGAGGGGGGGAGQSAGNPATDNEAPTDDPADGEVAPVAEIVEQPLGNTSNGSSDAALLAVLATGVGMVTTAGLVYAVMRRR